MIKVTQTGKEEPMDFSVRVEEGGSTTNHRVTMSQSTFEELTDGSVSPQRCVEAAFEFSLKNESKESILSSFDVTIISKYFPGFRSEFGKYIHS